VFGVLRVKLQDLDMYSSNFNTRGDRAEDVTVGSLADDLADVWRDLRAGPRRPGPWLHLA
jgi:hypothetical protein